MTVQEEETLVRNKSGRPKARGVAFILSLIPGGGYMYLGLMNRGLQTMLIFFGAIFIGSLLKTGFVPGLIIPVLMLYTIFDTQQIASEMNSNGMAIDRGFWAWSAMGLKNPVAETPVNKVPSRPSEEGTTNNPGVETEQPIESIDAISSTPAQFAVGSSPEQNLRSRKRHVLLAYIFIGLGILALFNNLFPSLLLERYLRLAGVPILLIGLGVLILYRNLEGRKGVERNE